MNDEPDKQASMDPSVSSHVTNAPSSMSGENYDPKIRTQLANEPDVVHTTRNSEPSKLSVSPDNQRRSQESRNRYPALNLSVGEHVILDVKRHPIGLLIPVFWTAIAIVAVIMVMIFYPSEPQETMGSLPTFGQIVLPLFILMVLIALAGGVAVWVYLQNRFYLTNESVIQEIQHSLFSRNEQTVSLGSIEDASFKQTGVMQMLFNYGTVRLSTEGEETTYRFSYVANPRNHIAILNNAIESFKNGRPVDPYKG